MVLWARALPRAPPRSACGHALRAALPGQTPTGSKADYSCFGLHAVDATARPQGATPFADTRRPQAHREEAAGEDPAAKPSRQQRLQEMIWRQRARNGEQFS